jgi:4-amino-4-deoxy-L-arabinose transferase-like glycosyltransferase
MAASWGSRDDPTRSDGTVISPCSPPRSMAQGPDPVLSPEQDRARRRRQGTVVVGLLLTCFGVLLAAGALPIAPGALDRALLLVGGAVFFAWVGGVLMGRASGSRSPRGGR